MYLSRIYFYAFAAIVGDSARFYPALTF